MAANDQHAGPMLDPRSMLFTEMLKQDFIPARDYQGEKAGYDWRQGEEGLGYYRHMSSAPKLLPGEAPPAKRQRVDAGEGAEGRQAEMAVEDMSMDDLDEETIARMLEEADRQEVVELDATGVKQLLIALERKINRNQKLRVKFPNQPDKFLESEVELDEGIKALQAVSAAPELYPLLVENNTVHSILGLLTHENTDISISAVGLLQELTEPDTISESEDALGVVDAIAEGQGLELLVQNLSRLNEDKSEEDALGVNKTMGVLENLLEAKPSLGPALCDRTQVLKWLLRRLKSKKFDENKLYCSEVLSILINMDSEIQRRVTSLPGGPDGMDLLLQNVAMYRRKDPQSPDEEECVENMFDSLAAALLVPENQLRFRHNEGFELMVRCLREKKLCSWCAVKVLDYALTDNPTNCERLVDMGGLKALFPIFMGRAAARKLKASRRRKRGDRSDLEEHVISIITSMALHLEDRKDHEAKSRLLSKFIEQNMEKVDRLVELHREYSERVDAFERQMIRDGRDTAEDSDDEEELKSLRQDAGAYTKQRLSVLLALLAANSSKLNQRVTQKLRQSGTPLLDVHLAVKEYLDNLGTSAEAQRKKLVDLVPPEVLTAAAPTNGFPPPPPPGDEYVPPPPDDMAPPLPPAEEEPPLPPPEDFQPPLPQEEAPPLPPSEDGFHPPLPPSEDAFYPPLPPE